MKNIFKYYFLLFLLISGCETDVTNVDLPEFVQKLVVTSFISPSDSVSYINVTSNRRIFGEKGKEEDPGALSGFISDGTSEVPLDTLNGQLYFSHKKMQVGYGKTYRLKISGSNGLTAEAECTVPAKREFIIEADTFTTPSIWENESIMNIRYTFGDIPGEENYYRTVVKEVEYEHDYWGNHVIPGFIPLRKNLLSDKGVDGSKMVQSIDLRKDFFMMRCDSVLVTLYLFNTEKSYYLYHKSLHDYSDENPFSETTPVFSNISGGLGVFTSYTIDSLVIRIK
jgi:hypothetical protein